MKLMLSQFFGAEICNHDDMQASQTPKQKPGAEKGLRTCRAHVWSGFKISEATRVIIFLCF